MPILRVSRYRMQGQSNFVTERISTRHRTQYSKNRQLRHLSLPVTETDGPLQSARTVKLPWTIHGGLTGWQSRNFAYQTRLHQDLSSHIVQRPGS